MNCLITFVIKINILKLKKKGIANSINHNFAKLRTDSYNSLHIKRILTFHNVMLLFKSVFNTNKNNFTKIYDTNKINQYLYIKTTFLKLNDDLFSYMQTTSSGQ